MRNLVLAGALSWLLLSSPAASSPAPVSAAAPTAAPIADYFQYPLPTWQPHCLSFGSPWRLCNGTVLRTCPTTGAIWLHTGVDIRTGIQPVMAAANGVIVGYIVDPVFRGGVLIRHATAHGIVLTQYWHVWPRPGFRVGTLVSRGQVFADVADMGAQTHLHFAVFAGDYEATAWRGALPPRPCSGFPAFPYRFVEPNAYVQAHLAPVASTPPKAGGRSCHRGASGATPSASPAAPR
jgi:murein DD-endopeptidase MepM/ murein hydrolase activator NlpD